MGREKVEPERDATYITTCDECGRTAVGGEVLIPVERDQWDDWMDRDKTRVRLKDSSVGDPLYRCVQCRNNAPTLSDLPHRETRQQAQERANISSMGTVLALVGGGWFIGLVTTLAIL